MFSSHARAGLLVAADYPAQQYAMMQMWQEAIHKVHVLCQEPMRIGQNAGLGKDILVLLLVLHTIRISGTIIFIQLISINHHIIMIHTYLLKN